MFPAVDKILSENPLFRAWKERSIFLQILGDPPILCKEFGNEWIKKVKLMVGDGPLTPYILTNIAFYIEKIMDLDGYYHIKDRLSKIDEQFFPTLSEIEFITFLLDRVSSEHISLEYTFKTNSGKYPELKIDYNDVGVYIEVTSITDYKNMPIILHYTNILSSLQLGLKSILNLNRKIELTFHTYPTIEMFQDIYHLLNRHLNSGLTIFHVRNENFALTLTDGDEVILNIPDNIIYNKLKDKIEEKTTKFDKNTYNFIVIDITPIVVERSKIFDLIKEYFDSSENKIILGVIVLSKKWIFEEYEPIYRSEISYESNPIINGKKALNIISNIFPRSELLY